MSEYGGVPKERCRSSVATFLIYQLQLATFLISYITRLNVVDIFKNILLLVYYMYTIYI